MDVFLRKLEMLTERASMPLSASHFRKKLFSLLSRVLAGDTVEILYKGVNIQLIAVPTKLSRAMRRNTLLCDPKLIVHSDPDLLAQMEAAFANLK